MASTSVVFDILARDRASDKFDKLSKSAGKTTSKMGTLARVTGTIGKAALFGLAGAAAVGGTALVHMGEKAGDLGETFSKVNQIFGKNFGAGLAKWAKDADTSLGMSQQTALDAAATFGVFGKAAGKTGNALASFAADNTKLAADLASFNNTSPEQAIEAIGAAFRGEAEPLRAYGVLLDDASMRQEAVRLGLIKTTKEALTPQQKVLSAQALIMKQTSDAQGDFERTSGGLANQQRILKAEFENMQTEIGQKVLPVMLKLATFANEKVIPALGDIGVWAENHVLPPLRTLGAWIQDKAVPAIQQFVDGMQDGTGSGGKFADALGKLRDALSKAWDILKPLLEFMANNKTVVATFAGVILTVVGAVKLWTAAQVALNLVMTANPFGIVVVALAALAAGLVYAYKKSETFRDIVDASLAACGKIFKSFWNDFAQPILHFLVEALAVAAEGFADLLDGLSHVPGFGWIKDVANGLHVAADQGHAVADSIQKIPTHKTVNVDVVVNTSAISKVQHQLETLGNTSGRLSANGRTGGGPFGLGGNNVGGPGAALIDSIVNGISKGKVKLQTALDKLKDYIQKHQDKLADLLSKRAAIVDAFKGFASSIFSTNLSVGEGEAPKGIQALLDFQRQQRAKAEQLRTDVGTLIGKGISQDLLTQLQNAGEAGEEQIHLLASGTVDEIRQANADNAATLQALQDAGLAASKAQGIEEAIKQEERDIKLADTIKGKLQELLDLQDKNTIVELHLDGQKIYVSLKKLKKQLGHGLDLD